MGAAFIPPSRLLAMIVVDLFCSQIIHADSRNTPVRTYLSDGSIQKKCVCQGLALKIAYCVEYIALLRQLDLLC